MKIVSILLTSILASFIYIKGQNKIERQVIDNLPNVEAKNEVSVDSAYQVLQYEIERVKQLQELEEKSYQAQLKSDRKVSEKQRELILDLLRDELKGVSK